jgi:DNA adenine methylase
MIVDEWHESGFLSVSEAAVKYIDPHKLRPHPENNVIYEQRGDEELIESIKKYGILQPLVVNSDYTIVSGHRRWRAALKLNMDKVPVVILEFENTTIAMIEYNRYRVKTPREIYMEAQVLRRELEKEARKKQLSTLKQFQGKISVSSKLTKRIDVREEVAKRIGVSTGYLTMLETVYREADKYPDIVKKVDRGEIPVSKAYNLIKSKIRPDIEIPQIFLGRFFAGKQRLAKDIIARMPPHTTYVEPFGGFCSVLLNKPPSPVEVYNDTNRDLVNLLICIKNYTFEFVSQLYNLPYSREIFGWFCDEIINTNFEIPDVSRAVKFYYLTQAGFAALSRWPPTIGNWGYSATNNPQTRSFYNKILNIWYVAARLQHVHIDNRDFSRVIEAYDTEDTFFYIDPPYYQTGDVLDGKFTEEDHKRLAEQLKNLRGKWLLTYNDHPKIRRLYKDFYMEHITHQQSASNTRDTNGVREQFPQLLIMNYDPRKEGLFYKALKQ